METTTRFHLAGKTQVFMREATGLVKEFSTLDLLLMACCLVFSLQAASVQFPWFAGFDPGADLRVALLISSIPFVLLMLAYWAAGVIMPRSGSDYVWVGRMFGPAVGFAWSAYYLLALFGAGFAGSVVSVVFGTSSTMTIWGLLFNSPSFVSFAGTLSSPTGTFALSALLTIFFAVIAIAGYKAIKAILYVGWALAVVGIAVMWYLLSVTTPTAFAAKWDSVLSTYTTYQGIFQIATKAGWTASSVTLSATLISMPIAVLFWLGGNFVNAISGEVKHARFAVPISLLLSLVLGGIFWITSSTLVINTTGYDWMSALGYLFDNASAAYNAVLPFQPSMPMMLSLIAYPNAAVILLIHIAFLIGAFPTLFFFYWIPSRYFFAWSFDRILPGKMADVNERFHTPHNSILAITVVDIVFVYLFSFTSWPSLFSISVMLWFSAFILPSIAVALVPYMKKDAFEQAPAFMKKRIASVPMITIIGVLSALSFAYLTYVALLNPLLAVVTTVGAYVTVGVVVTALVIYYASLLYHKRQGLDIRMAFKVIPPE